MTKTDFKGLMGAAAISVALITELAGAVMAIIAVMGWPL